MVIFFNDTATTEIYTLSLHDALPISGAALLRRRADHAGDDRAAAGLLRPGERVGAARDRPILRLLRTRSEEHTSELQSRQYLVCRLLLAKKPDDHSHVCRAPALAAVV